MPDEGESRLPLAIDKPVIAHHMTMQVPYVQISVLMNEAAYRPDGTTKSIGGFMHALPQLGQRSYESIADARAFEMLCAKETGVDAFSFYYPLSSVQSVWTSNNRIIGEFANAPRLPGSEGFKFALWFADATLDGTTEQRVQASTQMLGDLFEKTKNTEYWVRTPDGRMVVFLYAPQRLLQNLTDLSFSSKAKIDPAVEAIARAYYTISEKTGKRFAYIYVLNHYMLFKSTTKKSGAEAETLYQNYLDAVLRYFPAVTYFASIQGSDDGRMTPEFVADRAREKGRVFIQDAMPDYYMSKVTRDGSIMNFPDRSADIFAETDFSRLWRYYIPSRGSELFREHLQSLARGDSPMLNLVTWNDYPEGHHLAPEINHNFAFSLLLRYYKQIWQKGSAPVTDEIAVFCKKYRNAAVPSPFNMPFVTPAWIISKADWEERRKDEDFLEIVTIASEESNLAVNGQDRRTVPAGITATRVPLKPGPVRVQMLRDGEAVRELKTTEWITDKPYRGDRITYAWSTICDDMYRKLFGKQMEASHEYAEENGEPYWKTTYSLK